MAKVLPAIPLEPIYFSVYPNDITSLYLSEMSYLQLQRSITISMVKSKGSTILDTVEKAAEILETELKTLLNEKEKLKDFCTDRNCISCRLNRKLLAK